MDPVTALRLQLLDAGWVPVPSSPRDKSCTIIGWPSLEVTEFHVENWERAFPSQSNTSLICGREYFSLDLDIVSDRELARRVMGLAFQHLDVTPFIRIGRAPKSLLVYRCAPGGIRSESYVAASGTGDRIDILATGRNFVAYGIHPETHKPYQWVGPASPLEDSPSDGPLVTQAQVEAFLDAADQIMPFARAAGDTGTGRATASDKHRVVGPDGKIIDGRESLLRDAIWRAAHDIAATGRPLTAELLAELGWDFFAAAADLEDGKWSQRDALIKVRALVRRIHNGTVKLTLPAPVAPSYFGSETRSAESGRQGLIEILRAFIREALDWFNRDPDAGQQAADQLLGGPRAPVWAIQVSTGTGKTKLAAATIAADRIARRAAGEAGPLVVRSWLYLVPTHRLGDDIAEQFIGHGITARVFRGREAFDPTDPEPDPERKRRMCLNLKQVRLALEAGAPVSTTCCRYKPKGNSEQRCKFYDVCSYQQQMLGEKPDVWIAAHEILFHPQKAFGEIASVIIDESFWQDGMRISKHGLDLTEIATALIPPRGKEDLGAELDSLRNKLVKALRAQPAVGGVARGTLASLTADDCTRAIQLEWQLVEKPKIWPGMPMHEIERAAKCIPSARRARLWLPFGALPANSSADQTLPSRGASYSTRTARANA